ncbi:MAG: rRNA cytosine-C5-methylase, partial [Pseudomonadota bacterium]
GAWRRNPDQRWRLDPGALDRLTDLQSRLLAAAADLVRPGGRLIYATCSILPMENDDRVAAFAAARKDFAERSGADLWAERVGMTPPKGLTDRFRATPARDGCDGFFAAVLERRLNASAP